MEPLKATLVIDYQNIHLTGAQLFHPEKPLHEHVIHPLHFANRLIYKRNTLQKAGMAPAILNKVLAFRGLPSADHDELGYRSNLAQKSAWEKDDRVEVTHRPLKYQYERTVDGRRATDSNGQPIIKRKTEKGIDVLCALAVVREARNPENNLVILASHDTDLQPCLDEALSLHMSKIETVSWFEPRNYSCKEIRPTSPNRIWNTRLDFNDFEACRDQDTYP